MADSAVTTRVLAEVDILLAELERARAASPYDDLSGGLSATDLQQIITRFLAAIDRYSPPGSSYRREAEAAAGHEPYRVVKLGGILTALRADVAAGYLSTIGELIHADVFADFLAMASELLAKGYKDPAAVVAGSVLEEHLRKLAEKAGLDSVATDGKPPKADRLNADLANADVYNKLEQKSVTAWLDLRNKAAHGLYDEYDSGQVDALTSSVRDFLIRHPA